jgi:hypothetical protein
MNLIVTVGSEPAVVAQMGRYDIEKIGGVNKQVYVPPIPGRPEGPRSVLLVVPGKEPIYLTAAEARAAAASLVVAADKLEVTVEKVDESDPEHRHESARPDSHDASEA